MSINPLYDRLVVQKFSTKYFCIFKDYSTQQHIAASRSIPLSCYLLLLPLSISTCNDPLSVTTWCDRPEKQKHPQKYILFESAVQKPFTLTQDIKTITKCWYLLFLLLGILTISFRIEDSYVATTEWDLFYWQSNDRHMPFVVLPRYQWSSKK